MSDLRNHYFNTLGIEQTDRATMRRALARAYQLRNFEIEHYWKRATYFWAFQVAIFAAFGLLWRQPATDDWSPITVALAGLGILTAFANTLSARGSRFWQENWETHIDMLEDAFEGRLYKTVWLNKGTVSFSVSRVNIYLSYCFTAFWFVAGCYVAWRFSGWPKAEFFHRLDPPGPPLNLHLCYVVIISIMIAVGACFLWYQRTKVSRATLPEADGSHGKTEIRRCACWHGRICGAGKSQIFIRRYAPDEP